MQDLDIRITVYPPIPAGEVTPLQSLILSHVLEVSEANEGLVPFTDLGPTNPIKVFARALIDAHEASKQYLDSTLNAFISSRVLALLPGGTVSPDALLEIDLSSFPWQFIVQDIVARSDTLREVVVIQWINHPSQRPETFGASVSLITANAIHHATSADLIDRFRKQDEVLRANTSVIAGGLSPCSGFSVGRRVARSEVERVLGQGEIQPRPGEFR